MVTRPKNPPLGVVYLPFCISCAHKLVKYANPGGWGGATFDFHCWAIVEIKTTIAGTQGVSKHFLYKILAVLSDAIKNSEVKLSS